MKDQIQKYISEVSRKEGFAEIYVKVIPIKNKDTSGLCHRGNKIIWINEVFPSHWKAKDIWKLCLHEISHLFPPQKELTLLELDAAQERCKKEGCSDVTGHPPKFWKHFDRLKKKYPFYDFLRRLQHE